MKRSGLVWVMVCTVLCMLLLCASASAASSGTCGTNVKWVLDDEGVLTITGKGAMAGYTTTSNIPWYGNRASIKKVVIGDGVTSIGSNCFLNCNNLASITIPDTVKSIGSSAFIQCNALKSVYIPAGVTKIEQFTFSNCTSLTAVNIPDGVYVMGSVQKLWKAQEYNSSCDCQRCWFMDV